MGQFIEYVGFGLFIAPWVFAIVHSVMGKSQVETEREIWKRS